MPMKGRIGCQPFFGPGWYPHFWRGDELFVVINDGMSELARGGRSPANLRTNEIPSIVGLELEAI